VLDHRIQKAIVYKLAFSSSLRFSELKPDEIENKLFNYHLKIVIRDGLVEKTQDGSYQLTAAGRRLGIRALDKQLTLADRAQPILFLIVRQSPNPDSPYLLYKRLVHPLKDRIGFMHAGPTAGESVTQTAQKQCLDKTGLRCEFQSLGGGFLTTYKDDIVESYVNFTLLVANSAMGDLKQNHANAEYFWQSEPDFTSPDMIPSMAKLAELYQSDQPFFVEETLRY